MYVCINAFMELGRGDFGYWEGGFDVVRGGMGCDTLISSRSRLLLDFRSMECVYVSLKEDGNSWEKLTD